MFFEIVQTMCLSTDILNVVLSFGDYSGSGGTIGTEIRINVSNRVTFGNVVVMFHKYHVQLQLGGY